MISERTPLTADGPGASVRVTMVLLDAESGSMLHSIDLDVDHRGGIATQDDYLLFGTRLQNTFLNTTGSFSAARL